MNVEKLELSLSGASPEMLEIALQDLAQRLREAGFRVEPVFEPPAEGEMGAEVGKIIVFLIGILTSESLEPLLAQWQEEHPQERIQMVHIEVREPKGPIDDPKPKVIASPDPPQNKP